MHSSSDPAGTTAGCSPSCSRRACTGPDQPARERWTAASGRKRLARSSPRLAAPTPHPRPCSIPHVFRIESRDPHSRCSPEQPAQSGSRPPDRRTDRRHGRVGLRQELARLRHALRGRPAALRRDVLAVRAPVPRPHGPPRGGPHRRRAARDRHRPDQSRAHLAQHGRHDDRAERSPEAAVRPRVAPALPQLLATGATRHTGVDLRQPRGARSRERQPAHRDLPGEDPEELRRGRGARAAGSAGLRPHPR